ncbi:MAG: hypothetical protein R6X09_00720 [Bacteroidales bacterium]
MKTLLRTSIIIVFLQILFSGLYAQSSLTKLDQRALVKQLLGSWKSDIGKDTALIVTNTVNDAGIKGYNKYMSIDGIILEEELIWNYSVSLDKYIITIEKEGLDTENYALWFTSEKKYKMIQYSDITSPEKASFRIDGEIVSPSMVKETRIDENNLVSSYTYNKDNRDNSPDGSRQNPKRDFPPEL